MELKWNKKMGLFFGLTIYGISISYFAMFLNSLNTANPLNSFFGIFDLVMMIYGVNLIIKSMGD